MFEILPQSSGNVVGLKLSGQLFDKDYKYITPVVEDTLSRNSKLRLLLKYDDFEGWSGPALWDDFKFMSHFRRSIERIAIVGGGNEDEFWPKISVLMRYFDPDEIDSAWSWISSASDTPS